MGILRRLLRFRIRTLLFVVLIAAAFFAWIGDDLLRARVQRPVVAEIEAAGGHVYFDFQIKADGIHPQSDPPGSEMVRSVLGDDIYATAECVMFWDPNTSDDDIKSIHKLPGLQHLSLRGVNVTDASVPVLLKTRRLKGLNLSRASLSPIGLGRLASLEAIRSLTLHGNSFSNEHFKTLPEFRNLETLQVIDAPISGDGLTSIGNMQGLKHLDFLRCPTVTDSGVKSLSGLRNLEGLSILQGTITDASTKTISKMTELKRFRIDGQVTDAGFKDLITLTKLELLDLRYTSVGDGAMAAIGKFPRLRYLDLWGTKVSNAGLREMKDLDRLKYLDITNTHVTDEGLQHLVDLPSLERLSVELSSKITIEGVEAFKAKHPYCFINCWELEPDGSGSVIETR